jgi:alpha-mannosidase
MHKLRDIYLGRVEKFLSAGHYPDDHNIHERLYSARREDCVSLAVWSVPFKAHGPAPPKFSEAVGHEFVETAVGAEFGPSWSTHWFRVKIILPSEWSGNEVVFRWSSGCEAMVFSRAGEVLQGLSPQDRHDFLLCMATELEPRVHEFYIV